MTPLCIDLYAGLGGWAEGFLAEGYEVIGFDIERHEYGDASYPAQLVLQDVLTLHGSQFRHAACIVASPPCQTYSYMAMPWKRAKQIAAEYRDGTRSLAELTALFDACFRIQREASEAAGRYIPMVVENVKGAQPWVGRARANFGSYYLWGDVGMTPGDAIVSTVTAPRFDSPVLRSPSWHGADHEPSVQRAQAIKNEGGSWFGIGSPGQKETGQNPVNGVKRESVGKGIEYGGDFGWDGSAMRTGNSKSPSRKAASAMIARIPFALASHIARCFKPEPMEAAS